MLLIFDRSRTDGNVRQNVGQISVIFGIQHLVGARKARLAHNLEVEQTYRYKSFLHIGTVLGVGLMEHTHISLARRSRLVCVKAGHYEYFVGDLVLHFAEPINIIHDRVFAIGGAGTYYEKQFFAPAFEYVLYLFIFISLALCVFFRYGIFFFYLFGCKQFSYQFHSYLQSDLRQPR